MFGADRGDTAGDVSGDAVSGEPNTDFLSLWMRFIAAVSGYIREQSVAGLIEPPTAANAPVRKAARDGFLRRMSGAGNNQSATLSAIDSAGAAGILTSNWSGGWGATRVFSMVTRTAVALDLSCEDYGLLYRLASHNQGPRFRVSAESRELGEVPQFNVIAEIKGTEKPDEYVLLGAHLDSWHGATGAMDNGTGTIMMLEAMRILKLAYPNPKRTIIIGHWGAE